MFGHIDPLEDVDPEDINIDKLVNRARENNIQEVIIATNPNLEGDVTAMYILERLEPLGIKVTQLARGMPSGSYLEYANSAVIADAIHGRKLMQKLNFLRITVMRVETILSPQLRQQMKLAPQVIQSIEILQLPMLALVEHVQQELMDNPVLEEVVDDEKDEPKTEEQKHMTKSLQKVKTMKIPNEDEEFKRLRKWRMIGETFTLKHL